MMRHLLLLFICFTCLERICAQSFYKVNFSDLKILEGTYAHLGNSTLQIAASPKDTMLYALIGNAKYKLRPYRKDIFLNNGNQEVEFVRGRNGIVGYKVKDETPEKIYKLVSPVTTFSENMWYARKPGSLYKYTAPPLKNDGLAIGSIKNSGLDSIIVRKMIERIVDDTYSNVHSILIVKDGKLVLEEYFYEYGINTLHELRSASKSFISSLVGIAVNQGLIKGLDSRIISYFPQVQIHNPTVKKENITIRNMLTQRSGLACNDYDPKSLGNEVKIYPTKDWVDTILNLPMEDSPGAKGQYCSGNSLVLGKVVENVSNQTLHDYAKKYLFSPLGVNDFNWDYLLNQEHQDDYGQLYLRPRDMAKYGLLYLNGGEWKGQQVISTDYVRQSLSKQSVVDGIDYGYMWWQEGIVSNGVKYNGSAAKGNGGQRIFLFPDQKMVVVITAGNYNMQSPANKMIAEGILRALKK